MQACVRGYTCKNCQQASVVNFRMKSASGDSQNKDLVNFCQRRFAEESELVTPICISVNRICQECFELAFRWSCTITYRSRTKLEIGHRIQPGVWIRPGEEGHVPYKDLIVSRSVADKFLVVVDELDKQSWKFVRQSPFYHPPGQCRQEAA